MNTHSLEEHQEKKEEMGFLRDTKNWREMVQQLEQLLLLQRTQAQFSETTWWLTTLYHSSLRGWETLFWSLWTSGTPTVHIHAQRQIFLHIKVINLFLKIEIKRKECVVPWIWVWLSSKPGCREDPQIGKLIGRLLRPLRQRHLRLMQSLPEGNLIQVLALLFIVWGTGSWLHLWAFTNHNIHL